MADDPSPMAEDPGPNPEVPKRWRAEISRWVPLAVGVLSGSITAGVTAGVGVAGLPAWAVVLLSVAFTAASALATNAITGPATQRIGSLWLTIAVLVAIIAGTYWYESRPTGPSFVNYVANKDLVLSGVAGAPPRTEYDAPMLTPGEENSANCYVVYRSRIWLEFRTNSMYGDGWAPLADFHTAPDATAALPQEC